MLLSKARLMGPLPAMAQTRLLGVIVDQNLSWIAHLQEVVRSFANKLSLLKKSNQGFYPVMRASRFILRLSSCPIDHFHCHATKKQIGNRPVEEAKEMKCYKQVSGLCGPQFLSYCQNVSRAFVELGMETPYWWTLLVHQYDRRKSTKPSGVHFFYKSSFFSLEN